MSSDTSAGRVGALESFPPNYQGGTSGRRADDLQAIAAKKGLTCIYPYSDELILDCDGLCPNALIYDADGNSHTLLQSEPNAKYQYQLNWFDPHPKVMEILHRGRHILGFLLVPSASGEHRHIYIKLNFCFRNWGDKVALQASLRSDSVKEALSIILGMGWDCQEPTVMFETPPTAAKVYEWRRLFGYEETDTH